MSTTDTVYRQCTLCEAHCGVAVTVDRDQNTVTTIRGDQDDPFSRGYLCPKAYALKGLNEDPDRLRRPVKRVDGQWVEISWEEGFALAADGLKATRERYGVNALGSYLGNPNVHNVGSTLYIPALLRALGTRKRFSASSVDQLPKQLSSLLMFGGGFKIPIPDVDRTDFFLVLGANPLVSNGSLMTAPDMKSRLRALKQRGGKLVVIDPRRSETAEVADEHHFIRPGTDALLLFSIVDVLFSEGLVDLGQVGAFSRGLDQLRDLAANFSPENTAAATGIAADTVRRLSREFAAADRAVCYGRIGTCTQQFGTLASWLIDCVTILTGNLDRPGGAMFPLPATGPAVEPKPKTADKRPYDRWRSRRGLSESFGELPAATMAEEIEGSGNDDPERIRALITVAGNPILSTPNGARLADAFRSLSFMVSVDFYINETTRFADVILPPTAPLEHPGYDLVFTQLAVRNIAKYSPAALEPASDSRDQWQILAELAGRLAGADARTVDEMVFSYLLSRAVGDGTGCPELNATAARAKLSDKPGPERILDLMLRAGPHGDRFDDSRDGLSLARVQAATHGIDLGPLEPRLPGYLGTPDAHIDLAPDLLVADVPRLSEYLRDAADADAEATSADASQAPTRPMVLIGRRLLRTNNSWMGNIPSLAKGPDRCTLFVHPDDAARIGLSTGSSACVRSRVGELVAPVSLTDEVMPGVVSLPHGFGHNDDGSQLTVARGKPGVNVNLLVDEEQVDAVSGNGVLSGIPVEISPALGT